MSPQGIWDGQRIRGPDRSSFSTGWHDSNTRLVLEKKEDMRRRGVPSPDEWDAVALTFAEPVVPKAFPRAIVYPELGIV